MVKNIKFERVSLRQVRMRNLGLVYQVMEWKALLDKIGRIWCNVAYDCPVFLKVSRYDILGPFVPVLPFLSNFGTLCQVWSY